MYTIGAEQRDPAAGLAPPPVSTAVVHRKSFPRVPPEILLRDYAAKFRLTGLTLTSLLHAVSPVVSLIVPPFIAHSDAGSAIVDRLLREAPRRPPLPLEHTKSLNFIATRVERERLKRRNKTCDELPKPLPPSPPPFDPLKSVANYAFDEVATSRISAVAFIRSPSSLEEREVLWGYDTGAVVRVRLHTFAADLLLLSRREFAAARDESRGLNAKAARAAAKAKAAERAKAIALKNRRDTPKENKHSVSSAPSSSPSKQKGAAKDEYDYADYLDDAATEHTKDANRSDKNNDHDNDESESDSDSCLSESSSGSRTLSGDDECRNKNVFRRTPRGVSLLGYHPVGGVTCAVFDAHTFLAVTGGADGTLIFWDVYNRYHPSAREQFARDDEIGHARATQQFAAYVRARCLSQTIRRAHDGVVSVMATHGELLLTGGADGLVRVWSSGAASASAISSYVSHHATTNVRGPPPQFVEYQLFRCGSWVRHIWCAAERSAQGDDVLITDDTGTITSLRACTLAQPPPSLSSSSAVKEEAAQERKGARGEGQANAWRNSTQWKRQTQKAQTLMDTIRLTTASRSTPQVVPDTRVDKVTQSLHLRRLIGRISAKRNGLHTRVGASHNNSESNERALALLTCGAVKQTLVVSRVLRIFNTEPHVAKSHSFGGGGNNSSSSLPLPATHDSTSTITRLIPLFERNLMITLGYSPVVRIVDMTRLVCVSFVEHPDLSAAGKGQSTQSNGNTSGDTAHLPSHKIGVRKGTADAVRFIDVIYVSSFDLLILLDNRDTVFVWDNVANSVLATWRLPHKRSHRYAMGLFTCGTQHYGTSSHTNNHTNARSHDAALGRPVGRKAGVVAASEMDSVLGITRVPFFVFYAEGLELCEVLIAAHARVEVKAHEDIVVGLTVLCSKVNTGERRRGDGEMESLVKLMKEQKRKQRQKQQQQQMLASSRDFPLYTSSASLLKNAASVRSGTSGFRDSDGDGDDEESEDLCNVSITCLQDKLNKVDGGMARVLSCSADGSMRFWSSSLKPLQAYNPKQLLSKTGSTDKMSRPPKHISSDVTSFHYSAVWNLAVTGHDDGSICFWPCHQQVATYTLHKDLHRNAVSGLAEANMSWVRGSSRFPAHNRTANVSANGAMELLVTVSYDGFLAAWASPREHKAVLHGRVRVSRSELLCVCFEATNELLVVGDNSGVVSTWRARDLQSRRTIPPRTPSPWRPISARESPLSFLVAGEVSFAARATPQTDYHGPQRDNSPNNNNNNKNKKDNRGKHATAGTREETGEKRVGHTEAVTALLVDGNLVFSGGEDGRVFLWDLHRGFLIREYFLLHERVTIERRRRYVMLKLGDSVLGTNSITFPSSRYGNPRTISEKSYGESEFSPPHEDVASIVLLKERRGDFIVGTREGWLYHFAQKDPYPHYSFRHTSPVRTMCVIREGRGVFDGLDGVTSPECVLNPDALSEESETNENNDFELAVGAEDGTIAVVRGSYFAALF